MEKKSEDSLLDRDSLELLSRRVAWTSACTRIRIASQQEGRPSTILSMASETRPGGSRCVVRACTRGDGVPLHDGRRETGTEIENIVLVFFSWVG